MVTKFSSSAFDSGRFRAHGAYDAHIEDDIFVCTVTGPLNIEGVIALAKARSLCLSEIKHIAAVPMIIHVRNSMLMASDAFEVYSQNLKLHKTTIETPWLAAYVMPKNIEGSAVMLHLLTKLYEEVGITWDIFEQEVEAKMWIKSKLAQA